MGDRGGERVRDEDGPGVKSACPEARSRDGILTGKGFMIRHLWIPLGLFIGLVILFETTDLDLRLSDPFFDFDRGVFFWKDSWWATTLIHSVGRIGIVGLGILIGVLLAVSFVQRGLKKLVELRMPLFFLLLVLCAGPGTIAFLKGIVNRPYPEHIKRYGGKVPYTRLFERPATKEKRYAGFPAAHAGAGYGLVGLYFVLRERRPKLAPWGLVLPLLLGSIFGFGQQVRGMHYASHNVWSAAICWFEALGLYLAAFRGKLGKERARALC